jgi:hypothetical protein
VPLRKDTLILAVAHIDLKQLISVHPTALSGSRGISGLQAPQKDFGTRHSPFSSVVRSLLMTSRFRRYWRWRVHYEEALGKGLRKDERRHCIAIVG